jgi:LCP family protein required for cell wall assembly
MSLRIEISYKLNWKPLIVFSILGFVLGNLPFVLPKIFPKNVDNPKVLAVAELVDQPLPSPDINQLTILFLGYGGAGHDGGFLVDAIQVLHVNFEKKVAALISIPRDLWVKFPGGSAKINTALVNQNSLGKTKEDKNEFYKKGGETTKNIVSQITGLHVDYFATVDFVGFERLIGQELDGIDVDVAETLDDPWYPIRGQELNPCDYTPQEIAELSSEYSGFELEKKFPCRYERVHYKPGINKMEGGDALKYVRSRHGSAAGDISRGKRQQEVLAAIKNKLLDLKILDNLPSIYNEVVTHVFTDIDLTIAEKLLPAAKSGLDFRIVKINLGPENVLTTGNSSGAFTIIPKSGDSNWQEVHKYIQEQLN